MLLLISNEGALSAEWRDHPLKGDKSGSRECHIGGDFLLIYRIDDDEAPGMAVFARAGTHSELFGK